MSDAQRRARFAELAPGYARAVSQHEASLGIAPLRQQLCASARGRVLEVAAGAGANLRHYAKAEDVQQLTLADGSAEMCKVRFVVPSKASDASLFIVRAAVSLESKIYVYPTVGRMNAAGTIIIGMAGKLWEPLLQVYYQRKRFILRHRQSPNEALGTDTARKLQTSSRPSTTKITGAAKGAAGQSRSGQGAGGHLRGARRMRGAAV